MSSESLINKLQNFLTDNDIKIEQDLLSTSLRELNFTQTLSLIDNLKVNDKDAVLELLNINAPVEEEQINEIDPSRSPWTQNGKHPGAMDADELRDELAVFDELRDRGDYLSPKELAQEDSLWHYLEQIDGPQVDEAGYGVAGSRLPSASKINAQTTKDSNNQRDFTNTQQKDSRSASGAQRTVAGGNKQATGVPRPPAATDVRGAIAQGVEDNARAGAQRDAEIERLKQLAYGRR